jgi:hypothetical protein
MNHFCYHSILERIPSLPKRTVVAFSAILCLAILSGKSALALTINFVYDPDSVFMNAGLSPQDIADMKAANTYAAKVLSDKYSDNIHVSFKVSATPGTDDLASSSTEFDPVDSYAALQDLVAKDASSDDDKTVVSDGGSMPAGADPITTPHNYIVTRAQAKALGLRPDDNEIDGNFSFGGGQKWTYDPNNRVVADKFDFIGTVLHEYTELMGRNSSMGGNDDGTGTPNYYMYDLFHYKSAGVRGLDKGPGRSFSVDNGTTLLKPFNDETANKGDDQDWADGPADSFNAFGPAGELAPVTDVDFRVMDIVGYDLKTSTSTVPPIRFANISTRCSVQTGTSVLIGGFIVTGNTPKKVLLRAIGPSLAKRNPPVPGSLADPVLELHSGNTIIAMNDNWMDAANRQEIIDTTVAPTEDAESAILITLNPGKYTAVVKGVGDATGIGLVEVYDLERTVDSVLANISTRGFVQPDPDALIGGIIITGTGTQRVLVRAIGPSLTNVPDALADPELELRNSNGALVGMNDNWRSTQEDEIKATTVPPTNDAESAIVETLAPGKYTAIVRGVNASSGVALVEAYALQPQ